MIFSVLLYVGLLASFSLNVTLLLRKPLPPPVSSDNHGDHDGDGDNDEDDCDDEDDGNGVHDVDDNGQTLFQPHFFNFM